MNPKTYTQHIKENWKKLVPFLIGYLLLVTDLTQVKGFEIILLSLSTLTFFATYTAVILFTYFYIKIAIKLFRRLDVKSKNKKTTIIAIVYSLFLGAFLGFTTNIIQALILVTFSKYIS